MFSTSWQISFSAPKFKRTESPEIVYRMMAALTAVVIRAHVGTNLGLLFFFHIGKYRLLFNNLLLPESRVGGRYVKAAVRLKLSEFI